ncbi:Leucine Rich Repeat [Seminavis robusta]|uniref:Leucine Rich Repeat n=1 Tax=Seminavis robusta TaxID=568900 RepID=A0A9N8DV14_9STRA|nr:Leucine Rich Repeat [Seminavis robusta]|eukprot:Sro267_g103560.1 Leucine Rich Repeat (314) ;mRNA; f:78717-79658
MKYKTQSQDDDTVQQQQTSNPFDALGNNVERKKEAKENKTQMQLVTFPDSLALDGSSLQPLDDVTCTSRVQPLPTLSPPEIYRASSRRFPEEAPGAYAVGGIRPMFYRPRHDLEELGLELVPTSQNECDGEDGLIHADPVDDSENGEIPTAFPITTRAKRLWKKKLVLFLSLQTMLAKVLVVTILVAFLLAQKSSNQTQSSKQQNGVTSIQEENPGKIASITQAPISLLETLHLPEFTLKAMESPMSPQTKAYQWLNNNINKSNNTQLPVWRLKQRFAMATLYYSTRGDYWLKNQGWLDWDLNECNWAQFHEK